MGGGNFTNLTLWECSHCWLHTCFLSLSPILHVHMCISTNRSEWTNTYMSKSNRLWRVSALCPCVGRFSCLSVFSGSVYLGGQPHTCSEPCVGLCVHGCISKEVVGYFRRRRWRCSRFLCFVRLWSRSYVGSRESIQSCMCILHSQHWGS